MKKIIFPALAAVGAAMLSASPASAVTCGSATTANLSVTGGSVLAACGFFDKNQAPDATLAADVLDYFKTTLAAPENGGLDLSSYTVGAKGTWVDIKAPTGSDIGAAYVAQLASAGVDLTGGIFLAFHTGGNKGSDWDNQTAFFYVAANPGESITSILPTPLNGNQSGGELYLYGLPVPTPPANDPPASAVPEPATWAMLLLGFGLIGAGLRGRRIGLAPRAA